MKETLIRRFTSRKFLLTLGAILGAVSAGLAGAMTWPLVVQAVVVAIVPFILGQSYVEGKVAQFVPPVVQQQLIENAAIALANKFIGNKVAQVTAALSPTVTQTNGGATVLVPSVAGAAAVREQAEAARTQAERLGIFVRDEPVQPPAIVLPDLTPAEVAEALQAARKNKATVSSA